MKRFLFLLIGIFTFLSANELDKLIDFTFEQLMNVKISTGSLLELDIEHSPASLTIIDKQKLSVANTNSLGELLEVYVPGFHILENKWVGEIWAMRGVASDINTKFLLLIDGNKTNMQSRDGTISEMYTYIGPGVKRVEILRGPAGVVYGSGAIAGIVNIVTEKATEISNEKGVIAVTNSQYNEELGSKTFSGFGKFSFESELHILGSGFYQQSDGTGMYNSKLYGLPNWNFPQWITPDSIYNAWPEAPFKTTGSMGEIPSKYTGSLDFEYKNFRLSTRYSHNERSGLGYFWDDPYKGIVSGEQELIDSFLVNSGQGHLLSNPNHLFYSASEAWGENRRIYGTDNIMATLSYEHELNEEDKLKFKCSQSFVSEWIRYKKLPEYYSSDNPEGYMEEFGEKRTDLEALYILKSVPKLQLALGTQYRYDNIGKDLNGNNRLNGDEGQPIVANIDYQNIAFLGESSYELLDALTLHGGIRVDKHTRTEFVPSPKVALIAKPFGASSQHVYKLFYQSASNNGSADSYEFNRYTPRDENGNVIQADYFEFSSVKPDLGSIIIKTLTLDDLHSLEPERTRSLEFTSYDAWFDNKLELETSISYNSIENLFLWEQSYFHVFNTTDYQCGVLEGEIRYTNDKLKAGMSHSYNRLIGMDYKEHGSTIESNEYDKTKVDSAGNPLWYENKGTEENPNYIPLATGTTVDTINAIYNMITVDNENFLNIAPHVTKLYVDFSPTKKLTLHWDNRFFWSAMAGRKPIFDDEAKYLDLGWATYNPADTTITPEMWDKYLTWYEENGRPTTLGIEDGLMFKANVALSYDINENVNLTIGAKNVFADPRSHSEFLRRNSLRWQLMVIHGDQALYTSDVRSVFGKIQVAF